MKRILLILASLFLITLSGYSQVDNPILPTSARFVPSLSDPEETYIFDTLNGTIDVYFDVVPNVPATVVFYNVCQEDFDLMIDCQYENIPLYDNRLSIPLNRERWGVPYDYYYNLHLVITFGYFSVDENGEEIYHPYLNQDGEQVIFDRFYLAEDNGPAYMVGSMPNNSMFGNTYSFADAYENGIITVNYSKLVLAPENAATVTLFDFEGELIDEYEVSLISQYWEDGLYHITFDYSSVDYAANDIGKIEIQVNPVTWYNPDTGEDELIATAPIILENKDSQYRRIRKNPTTGVERSLIEDNSLADVYDISGRIIKGQYPVNEIRNLAPGIYIANGKKYVVR